MSTEERNAYEEKKLKLAKRWLTQHYSMSRRRRTLE
jgi:hypothetical protein